MGFLIAPAGSSDGCTHALSPRTTSPKKLVLTENSQWHWEDGEAVLAVPATAVFSGTIQFQVFGPTAITLNVPIVKLWPNGDSLI